MKRAALYMQISTKGHGQTTPLLTVHKTTLNNDKPAIENIDGVSLSLLLFVHLNEFSWTPDAKDGEERQG